MSVSISEPRSRARLKRLSAEFDVGIESGVAMWRERERALEAVDRISGIQRGQEITAKEKGRVFCRLARRQEHCSSPGGSISNSNVREGITWPPFREGPGLGSQVPETGHPENRRLNLTRGPRQDGRVRMCMIGAEERVEERD
jgi:hypothetical protein